MKFEYISAKEAALKLHFTERWIQKLCKDGRAEQAQGTDNDYATVARGGDEYVSLAEAAIFEYAFRIGAGLAREG